jgi:hypothetical protein
MASRKTKLIKGAQAMNTLLITSQIVFYGVGIVSASVNIASVMRTWRSASMGPSTAGSGTQSVTKAIAAP